MRSLLFFLLHVFLVMLLLFMFIMDLCNFNSSSFISFLFFFCNLFLVTKIRQNRPIRPQSEPEQPDDGGGRWRAKWFGVFQPTKPAVAARNRPQPTGGQPYSHLIEKGRNERE